MCKSVKWIMGFVLSLSCTIQASYNRQLLDAHADSLNERLWSKNSPISSDLILENLDFLDDVMDGDKVQTQFEKYVGRALDIGNDDDSLKEFVSHCQTIYDDHAEIYLPIQVAVNMLLERTLEKYNQQATLLERTNSLLPLRKSKNEENSFLSNTKAREEDPLSNIPDEYRGQIAAILAETINNIARNFFPEIDQGKLTLETLSLRCGQEVETLRRQYASYHNQSKKESS